MTRERTSIATTGPPADTCALLVGVTIDFDGRGECSSSTVGLHRAAFWHFGGLQTLVQIPVHILRGRPLVLMDEEAAVFPLSFLSPYLLRVPEAPSVAATNPPADPTLLIGTTIGFGGSPSTVVPHH